MKIETWYFVVNQSGQRLAAFPNEELAESYKEGIEGWAIREAEIVTLK